MLTLTLSDYSQIDPLIFYTLETTTSRNALIKNDK